MSASYSDSFASAEELIEEARQGRLFILADDEDRENEGDLILPASHVTPEAIAFMARFGRGLVCLALDAAIVERLGLPPMTARNDSPFHTAFTVSIEAREGITTGISAADRARTIQAAIAPSATPRDLVMPGHIFPLAARDGGVLVRPGHTEAAVDIARMAGLAPAGIICEIMNDDGTMARLPDLRRFAREHSLKLGTVAELIRHRIRTEMLAQNLGSRPFTTRQGNALALHTFRWLPTGQEALALVRGPLTGARAPVALWHRPGPLQELPGRFERDGEDPLGDAFDSLPATGPAFLAVLPPALPGGCPAPEPEALIAQILRLSGVRAAHAPLATPESIRKLEACGLAVLQEPLPKTGTQG